jgi:pimeloyl-ACP methyl ester carboxylesterase
MKEHIMGSGMQWVDLGDTALRYEWRPGQGAPLVLLHELGGSINSWDRFLGHLGGEHPVLRYDARGCGMSEKLRAAPSAELLADDVARLLDTVGIDAPVTLVGCALGGAVALTCAARHPGRVAGVVALSPVTEVAPERHEKLLAMADQVCREGLRAIAGAMLPVSFPGGFVEPQAFDAFRARWLANDPDSYAWQYRMLVQIQVRPLLPRVRCPALVVACEKDALRPAALSEEVAAALPNARLARLASGHFAHIQTAPEVAALARDFLAR